MDEKFALPGLAFQSQLAPFLCVTRTCEVANSARNKICGVTILSKELIMSVTGWIART
jgi:hypothetical protein